MKKLFVIFSMLTSIGASAQSYVVESAKIALKEEDLTLAKSHIDRAAANESTKNSPEMWLVRGNVYVKIAGDEATAAKLEPEAAPIALQSYLNCLNAEKDAKKQRNSDEARINMVDACRLTYMRGLYHYDNKNYEAAINAWGMIVDAFPFDKDKNIEKMNLNRETLLQNCADVSVQAKDYKNAKKFLELLIAEPKYKQPLIYTQMALILMEENDTNAALGYIEKGLVRYPEDKNLFNLQLNIFSSRGDNATLIHKLSEAIASDPNNAAYLFNRGMMYDQEAVSISEAAKTLDDSAHRLNTSAKSEKNPATKNNLKNSAKKVALQRDSLFTKSLAVFAQAEADYKAALANEAEYFDALFNMGVLYFNSNAYNISIFNNVDGNSPNAEQQQNKIREEMNKQYDKALEYLNKAYAIKQDDPTLLFSLQQTYAQKGNMAYSTYFRVLKELGKKMPCDVTPDMTIDQVRTTCGETSTRQEGGKTIFDYDNMAIHFDKGGKIEMFQVKY